MLYDLTKPGVEVGRLHDHHRQVHKVDFNPQEGTFLLSGSQDGTVRLWDLRDFRNKEVLTFYSRNTFHGRGDGVRHTKWSPEQRWDFALATDNGTVQHWDTRNSRSPVLKITAHNGTCNSIDWHPDGKHLVSAGRDREVKVWDMLGDKRQKPAFQLRTPQEVQNVRWRPPCLVSGVSDQPLHIKQCIHLATSYRYNPVVHVWDLRRRYIPFQEFHHQVNDGTTDMMWQSKDNLWTVGPEGEFTQSDIRHATSTRDRKPLQTFAFAPDGDMTVFVQARPRRRRVKSEGSGSGAPSTPKAQGSLSRSPGMKSAGKSFGSPDENFLSTSLPNRRRSRGSSFVSGGRWSLGSTPPSYEDALKAVTNLDKSMKGYSRPVRHQVSVSGPLDRSMGPIYKVLAQHYLVHQYDHRSSFDEFTLRCQGMFRNNAMLARLTGKITAAQAFELVYDRISDILRRMNEYPMQPVRLPASLPNIKPLLENFQELFYDLVHYLAALNAVQDAAVLFLTAALTLRRAHLPLLIAPHFDRLESILASYEDYTFRSGFHQAASLVSSLAATTLVEQGRISDQDEPCNDGDALSDAWQAKPSISQEQLDRFTEMHPPPDSSTYESEPMPEETPFASVTSLNLDQYSTQVGRYMLACPVCGAAVPRIMVCCRKCQHVAHTQCLSVWWQASEVEGKCPSGDCLCRCWRGEKESLEEIALGPGREGG